MWKYLSIGAVAFIGLGLVVAKTRLQNSQTANQQTRIVPAPAWRLLDVTGKPLSSANFRGKVVILDFWATWCPPCLAEIPGFIELQKTYGDRGLVIVGVSMDHIGADKVADFVRQHGINYPIVMGDAGVEQAYGGVEALPTTFIIDRAGNLVKMHVGYADRQAFENEIKPLL